MTRNEETALARKTGMHDEVDHGNETSGHCCRGRSLDTRPGHHIVPHLIWLLREKRPFFTSFNSTAYRTLFSILLRWRVVYKPQQSQRRVRPYSPSVHCDLMHCRHLAGKKKKKKRRLFLSLLTLAADTSSRSLDKPAAAARSTSSWRAWHEASSFREPTTSA